MKSKHLQIVSGISPQLYWIGTYAWDLMLYFLLTGLAMSAFFVDKLSEANLRNVMKQATLLATGEGVPHKRYPNRYFRKGEPVTLDEDMTELRAAANRFLLPEDDPGHGWCLDHPIGKMGIFQAYLHAKGGA